MCQDAFRGQEKIPDYDVASGIFREPPKRDAEIHLLRDEVLRISKRENSYGPVAISTSQYRIRQYV